MSDYNQMLRQELERQGKPITEAKPFDLKPGDKVWSLINGARDPLEVTTWPHLEALHPNLAMFQAKDSLGTPYIIDVDYHTPVYVVEALVPQEQAEDLPQVRGTHHIDTPHC